MLICKVTLWGVVAIQGDLPVSYWAETHPRGVLPQLETSPAAIHTVRSDTKKGGCFSSGAHMETPEITEEEEVVHVSAES